MSPTEMEKQQTCQLEKKRILKYLRLDYGDDLHDILVSYSAWAYRVEQYSWVFVGKEEEQIIEDRCRKVYIFWTHNKIPCGRDKYKAQQKNGAEAPHFLSLKQDNVTYSQEEKWGLKYKMQIPRKW